MEFSTVLCCRSTKYWETGRARTLITDIKKPIRISFSEMPIFLVNFGQSLLRNRAKISQSREQNYRLPFMKVSEDSLSDLSTFCVS